MSLDRAIQGKHRRAFSVLLAVYLVATQILAFMHQHQSLEAGKGEVCLKCMVLQQASSALPAVPLSFFQSDTWLILPQVFVPDSLPMMQVSRPAARGPPSCTLPDC